jgi:hypothetical protein
MHAVGSESSKKKNGLACPHTAQSYLISLLNVPANIFFITPKNTKK